MQLRLGNVTLREDQIDWVPWLEGRQKANSHLALAFDCSSPCGESFINVAFIHDPKSPNPGLNLTSESATMGVASIARMLILLEAWRLKHGLDSSNAEVARYEDTIEEVE